MPTLLESIERIESQYARLEEMLKTPGITDELKDKIIKQIQRLDRLVDKIQRSIPHEN